MTTTIVPGLGHAPLWTQQGTGATPGYDAIDRRRADSFGFQEGAMDGSSFVVTQRASGGAAMFVDIAASTSDSFGSGIAALVQGDSVAGVQGLYPVPPHTVLITEAITAAHATLPRIDMVVLEVQDHVHDGSGANLCRTRVVAGTATSGATLANRTGAAALPNSCLLLADVLVGGGVTSITNSVIRDRRKFARGAFYSAAITTGDYIVPASVAALDTTRLRKRVECSGAPVRVRLHSQLTLTSSNQVALYLYVDGAQVHPMGFGAGAGTWNGSAFVTFTPAAGSRLIEWQAAGTGNFAANSFNPMIFEIEEILRQNAVNNAITTG